MKKRVVIYASTASPMQGNWTIGYMTHSLGLMSATNVCNLLHERRQQSATRRCLSYFCMLDPQMLWATTLTYKFGTFRSHEKRLMYPAHSDRMVYQNCWGLTVVLVTQIVYKVGYIVQHPVLTSWRFFPASREYLGSWYVYIIHI